MENVTDFALHECTIQHGLCSCIEKDTIDIHIRNKVNSEGPSESNCFMSFDAVMRTYSSYNS